MNSKPPHIDPEQQLPDHHNPLPALTPETPEKEISAEAFEHIQNSAEFQELKRKFRNFAFPMTVVFLVWYFVYVLLSSYARGFMSQAFIGHLNVGMAMGLAQFASTFLITWLYIRHANRNLDPLAAQLRAELEGANHG